VDAEASLPAVIEEVRKQMSPDKQRVIVERSAKHAEANNARALTRSHVPSSRSVQGGTRVRSRPPASTAELWPLIENEDWILSSPSNFSGAHNTQLWIHDKPYSYLGGQGAGGMGYGAPASVGAALAAKSRGQIVINVQTTAI
jgi:thiamine pyrophosphate-dependent acetolactate synthase large subunit-like protein